MLLNYASYSPSAPVVRLQNIVDGDGRTNFIYYTANAFSTNLISQVVDGFGRTSSLLYDTTGHLTIEAEEAEPRAELRVGCRDPFEQMPPAHEQAKQRSSDRIGHRPCLMREERNRQCGPGQSKRKICAEGAQVASSRHTGTPRYDRGENGEQGRHCDRQ